MYYKGANQDNFLKANRPKKDIQYIVVHYTANDGDTARNNVDYYARESVKAGAHYFVDENEVACSVPWYDVAYHCGGKKYPGTNPKYYLVCRNYNSIGVEMCSEKDSAGAYYFTDKTIVRAAEFIASLMKEYNVPIDRVIRHYDVTGKLCPRPFIDERTWAAFKTLVMRKFNKEDVEMEYYEKLEDIPAGEFRDTVKMLVEKGVIKGTGNGLHLSYENVRMLVYVNRWIGKDVG